MKLRPYQEDAVDAVYAHLRERDDNPVVVIPTAGGKTPILATICRDAVSRWNGRVLVVSHVKELLAQAVEKLKQVASDLPVGVYSAGLKRRDTSHGVIVAGIQSVYRRACELDAFDLIIVDEAHLIPADGEGMYRQFLADARIINPRVRVIGLTATPYRLDSGSICSPDHFLNSVCYEVGIKELIRDGYLCPLVSKSGSAKADMTGLHVRGGEFIAGEVEDLMDQDALVEAACQEIVEYTADRNAALIFASGVKHGKHVVRALKEKHGIECGFVCGDTPAGQRDELLARFRGDSSSDLFHHKPLKYLCNVNVLTTGFDAPNIDCVALLRPTMSPGLYCLDSETEILAECGWRRIGQIAVGDKVAAFDTNDESIRYVQTLATIEREAYESENFVTLETPATSLRVTDLHRLIMRTRRRSDWRAETALKTSRRADGVELPKSGYVVASGAPLSDDELRFIGWVMTDGNINGSTGAVSIAQSIHQPWVGEIQRVIQSCGFKHGVALRHRETQFSKSSTMAIWTISKGKPRGRATHLRGWGDLDPWLDKEFSERLLREIDSRQLGVLLEAIHLGDGAKHEGQAWTRRSYHIGTANVTFAERLQICAVTRGYRCSVAKSTSHPNDFYYLHIKKQVASAVASRYDGRPTWQVESAKGERVWCVQNELGTLVTRRHGKVTIVGNCQMVGRGFRLHPNKADCLVLDFGGNAVRHGPVDQIKVKERSGDGDGEAPAKECPKCHSVIAAAYAVCPDCGFEFPPSDRPKHEATASDAGILSGEVALTQFAVSDILYNVHTKRGAGDDDPKTMRVDYKVGWHEYKSEWICFEHSGYARQKAIAWWKRRSPDPVPTTAERAVELAQSGAVATTLAITVRSVSGDPYERIVDHELGDAPDPVPEEAADLTQPDLDEIPF